MSVSVADAAMLLIALDLPTQEPGRAGDAAPSLGYPDHEASDVTLHFVEVGGWLPGVWFNPSIEQVGAIADAYLAFLTDLPRRLARLEVAETKAEAEWGGIFAVSTAIENAGYFPSALAQGVRARKADPVRVRLGLAGAELIVGRVLERIGTLPGSCGRREFRWLILAPDLVNAVRLEASCPKTGRVVRTIELD